MSWTVYSKDGKTVRCVLNKLEYSGTFMGERTVSATLSSDKRIEFNIFDYIEYRGERFEIELLPTVKKISSNNYSYDLRFVSLKYELERCMMRDIVPNDNGIVYPTPLTIEFTGTVRYLAERIQACLDAMYGTGVWSIGIAEGTESEEKSISMSNQNCWDALSLVNTEYKLNYFVKGRNVTIGGSEPVVDNVFEYGKGKGLYEIERISDSDTGVVTKLRAYGGTRNLDYSYPKLPEWEDSVLPTNYALSPLRLMLPSFKTDGVTDFVLASNEAIAKYGIREGVITYDDIYPSITGMKNSAGQAIDEIKSVDAITSETQPTFTVQLYDLGFDLNESYMPEAQLSMKSGALQGYAFTITKIVKASDGSYTLTLGRNTLEEADTDNFTVPNKDWNMKAGDKFVLLNILMPQEYIRAAENRLLERAKEYLAKYSSTNYSYNIGVDEIFMARNANFYNEIMEGKRLTVNDPEMGIDHENVIIQSLSIKEGEGLIPTFEVTLNNEPSASTLDRIQGQISGVEASVNSKFSSESELSKQYRKKLDKAVFDSVFKLHYDDPDNPNLPTSVESLVGFWTERWMSSMGLNPGTGGGEGGASTLGGLNNVGPWADEVPSADRVMVQLKGATHWTSKPLSEIVGLDTEALGNYLTSNNYAKKSDIPSLSGYATEAWVTTKLGSYATASSLKAVSDKLDDFLTGTDTDTVINKWKELEDFLSGFKETDTLAGALALKADKTQLADYVTLGTTQTITANKKFSVDAASVISVDNNAKTSTSDYAAIIFRHGGEHIGGIAANKNDNYLYRASVNFTTSYKILDAGNYTETLDGRYVKKSGDAMTGVLQFSGALNVKHHNYGISTYAATGSSWEGGYKYFNTAGSAQLGAFGAYGSSNALNYLYIGKSYDDTWLKVTGGAVVPLEVRSSNATGQVIQVCDASGTGAELGWYSGIGAFIQNDRLSSLPTISLGGVDSLAGGLRFRYSGNYYNVWHGGNLPKSSLWAGAKYYDHGVQADVYTPYQFISTFLNNDFAGLARRGSWAYANNGQITTDWGNMHLAGTAYMAWGYNKTRTMLFITPSTRNAGADLTNEMMFYTCNEPNEAYPSRWTRVLTSRNYNKYSPTLTGGGASGTWGISVSGNAASATKLQTARSLWGQSFDGTGNVSGSMSGVGTITPLSNNAYTLGTNGVRFSNAFVTSWIYAGAGMYMDGPAVTRNNSFVELSNGGNEMVVSSGAASDIHINYRAPGYSGRKAPATWYWRAGSSSSWANFNLGSLTANGNISATGLLNAPRIMTAAIRIECDNTGALNGHGSEINNFNSHLYLQHHSGTNLVCCNGGGKAGIGTASPSYKLHVVGDVYANGGWLRSSGATGWYNETYGGGWYMADGTYLRPYNSKIIYSSSGILAAYSAGSWISMAQRTTCIYADNNNSASSAHALFRTKWNNGNAMCYGGLGDEMGFYAFPKSYIDNSNNSYSWKTVWSSSGTLTHYGTFRATVGMWTDGYASAMGSNTSDIRLKTNIRDFNATEIIRKLRPVAFEWNNMAKQRSRVFDTEDTQYGLVAQEVKAVTPWAAVDNMFGDGYMGVRYEKYIPVLLKAQIEFLDCLSEEQKKIRELERKLANVEKENRELLEFKRKVEQRLSA